MKRNRTMICGVVCAAVLLICTAGVILRAGSLGLGTGRVLLANGETMLICANMPIQLTNKSGNDALFARLSDGDRVLVLHGAIAESYPGRADAYALLKVGEGSIADIPDAVLEQLALLGWRTDVKMEIHSVSMECTDWLYEELPSFARAGETVNVKISKAYDVGYLFLVNGEQIEMHDDTDDYWLFSFTMPNEDVEIDFKTYDGFLPDAAYGVLIEAFWIQNPWAEYVNVREYYGEYDGGAMVAMMDCGDYTDNEWSEEAAGCTFFYGDGNRLQVLYEGVFYPLDAAYANGYITDADIQTIFLQYKEAHAGAYEENGCGK